MTASNAVPGFRPSAHGLRFANRFPPGPTIRLGPLDPRLVGVGDAAAGLCGGMSWLVRERFEAGLPVPPDTTPPENGSVLFRSLVRRQIRSLDWLRGPLRFWWMSLTGPARTLRRSREIEWPRIRRDIDAGRLPLVGLVRHRGWNPWRLKDSHQVLGFGYTVEDGRTASTTIRVYDPNWPGRDDVVVALDGNGLRQSTGEPVIALLYLG